jgi:DNA-binding NarL/FixJ family response regulator
VSAHAGNIAVMIVADHPIMRDGLRFAIRREADMEIVGEACDEAQALLELGRCQPSVILLDLQQPQGAGRHAARAVRDAARSVPLVVLSTFPSDWTDPQIRSLEPLATVPKTASSEEIIHGLRGAVRT